MSSNIEATINQTFQAGFETSPGSGGAGTYLLQSLTIDPTDELATKTYKPQGRRFKALVEPDKQWTSFAVSGDALYSEPLLLFENIFGTAAPTTIDTDVYKRVYD